MRHTISVSFGRVCVPDQNFGDTLDHMTDLVDQTSSVRPLRRRARGKPPRDGVMRSRTTVRLDPEDLEFFKQQGEILGLSLTDTLAFYCAVGAGIEVQPAIRRQLEKHRHATGQESLPIGEGQEPLPMEKTA